MSRLSEEELSRMERGLIACLLCPKAAAEIRGLREENARLREENELLKDKELNEWITDLEKREAGDEQL